MKTLFKNLALAVALLFMAGRSQASTTTYYVTNDLANAYNTTFYFVSAGVYTYSTNQLIAPAGNVVISQGGVPLGVSFQSTNPGTISGAAFTGLPGNGCNLSLIRSNAFTQYTATNDLGGPLNVSYFYYTNGTYTFGTNQLAAAGANTALAQAGLNWSGLTVQATNGSIATACYFTNINLTGGKFSMLLSNDFYLPPSLWSGSVGSVTASNAFATNVPGSITAQGTWTNSSH